ncbi:MAG: (d)CMP kinase [Nitrospirae bacterium YQR-1]
MPRVIAIDGPAGAGKSTVAKELSRRLGFNYLDTGALYRATALKLVTAGLDEQASDGEIMEILKDTNIEFSGDSVFLDNKDVSGQIRAPEIGHYTSVFSSKKVVRDFLLIVQKEAGGRTNLVAEGRDMATVVFPEADRKFFITADEQVRAARRYSQLNGTVSFDSALSDVRERDRRDTGRANAPLKRAADAIEIDTTGKDVEEVLSEMMRKIG